MPTEDDRHELRLALERRLGPGPAATLMELLPPVDWSEIARRSDIAELRAELKVDIADLRVELKSDIAELKGDIAELKGDFAGLKGDMAEMRADMKGQVTRFVVGSLPLAFGTAGLVLAAAKLT